jgi:hypothetical protein
VMKHVASRGVGIGCAESLTAFIRRAGGAWSAQQPAIANGIDVNGPLEPGWAVKVPVREAHGGWRTRPPPGVRRNCPTCGGGAPVITGLVCRPSIAWMARRRESAQLAPVSSVGSPESVDDTRCGLGPANGMAIAYPHGRTRSSPTISVAMRLRVAPCGITCPRGTKSRGCRPARCRLGRQVIDLPAFRAALPDTARSLPRGSAE